MTTSQVGTSHTKKYELTHFARYSLVWFCDLGRISSVDLAQACMIATLILSLWLRIVEAGHPAVFHQNRPVTVLYQSLPQHIFRMKLSTVRYNTKHFNYLFELSACKVDQSISNWLKLDGRNG